MSKAENAVLAMSRAMYGKRIRQSQFEHMLSLKTAGEIANYLKSSTGYADGFDGVTSGVYNARVLERAVNISNFKKVAKLCKLEYIIGQSFYKYFITRLEIDQILRCTSFILSGEKDEYMLDFCGSIERELTIDLYKLGNANTLGEVAQALADTPYADIYLKCLNGSEVNYLIFETAFNSYFAHCSKGFISSVKGSKSKKAIHECISHNNDVRFIEMLARTILHYKNYEAISSSVLPGEMTLFTPKQVESLLKCGSVEELDEILYKTVYRPIGALSGQRDIKCCLNKYLSSYYSKLIRFSSCPAVVMYSFMCRLKIEGSDVIKIIEGNRYGIDAAQLRQCICCVGHNNEKEEDLIGN